MGEERAGKGREGLYFSLLNHSQAGEPAVDFSRENSMGKGGGEVVLFRLPSHT